MNSDFRARVLQVVAAIPAGATMTYGEVAGRAGNLRAARAVGAILRTNHNPNIPCHRVVGGGGRLGGYNRGLVKKRELLARERGVQSD